MTKQTDGSGFVKAVRFARLSEDLQRLFDLLRSDENIRAAVIFFEPETMDETERIDAEALERLRNLMVPVVAAVNGFAGRPATELVTAAHLSIAGDSSRFAVSASGAGNAGITAAEALKSGLITSIFPAEAVEKEALSLAERISEMSPAAVRAWIEAVCRGFEMTLDEGLKLEAELFVRMFATADMREGTTAFLEKRKPVFRGK